jgi:ATP-binding cassette, subfamily B, bacterial IrtA/YbtP
MTVTETTQPEVEGTGTDATRTDATGADEPSAAGDTVTLTSGVAALLPFARPARGGFIAAAVLASVASVLSLVPFWAIYRTVDEVVDGSTSRGALWGLAAVALIAVVARFVLFGVSLWVSHLAAYDVLYGIRMGLAEHLTRVPLGYVTRRRSGDLKKVMGDDVERLELFLAHGIPDMAAAVVTLVSGAVWMFVVDWRMALAAVGVVVPAFACLSVAMRRGGRYAGDYHRTLGEMNASMVELVRGMPVVKVFNRGTDEVRAAESTIREHVRVVRRYSSEFLPLGTAFFVLLGANILAIVPLGVWLWDRGSLPTADLLFFFIVGLGALVPVATLLHLSSMLNWLASGGNLVRDVLDAAVLEDAADAAAGPAGERPADSSVELRGVSFAYEGHRVLRDVSLRAEPGTITALVGPSGAGKSTIASLIARFWDVDEGAVLVGGVDVRRLPADVLTRQVAVVFQDTFLFDDTVAGNLRVAKRDATPAELEAACRAARAHEFVVALPQGYDTPVGERGARLSGGERQRLTLARAILADAPVIVLDEATAFTDPENEAAIQDAIGELVAGKTVIMIAHRLSTVVGADQIVVIDDGQVVEVGRHGDLLASGGLYAGLWEDFTLAAATPLGAAVHSEAAAGRDGEDQS